MNHWLWICTQTRTDDLAVEEREEVMTTLKSLYWIRVYFNADPKEDMDMPPDSADSTAALADLFM